jgi:hypothetical protein
VIEQSVNEVASNVDDLRELYDIEKAKEFIVLLARNFGFKELSYEDVEKNVQLLDNQVGFVQWKGSEEFFKWLLQLFEIGAVFRDLSRDVFMWSGGRGWDSSVIEDAKYYRDGSVEVTVPIAKFWAMKELERFVSAGVYVWYQLISGVRMMGAICRISDAYADPGFAERVRIRVPMSFMMGDGVLGSMRVEVVVYGMVDTRHMVGDQFKVILGGELPISVNLFSVVVSESLIYGNPNVVVLY